MMKIIQDLDKTFKLENQNNFTNAQKDNNQQRAKETGSSDMKKAIWQKGFRCSALRHAQEPPK